MFRTVVVMVLALTLLVGVVYPVTITAIAQLLFPYQANGSRLIEDGKVYGSLLIGQQFKGDEYFWSRPSATSDKPYNLMASGGSNLGYGSKKLQERMNSRVKEFAGKDIPVDLVTASGSGLDPHISVAAAIYQVNRVALARDMDREQLMKLVELATLGKQFGILGESTVNVVKLNLLLDKKLTNR